MKTPSLTLPVMTPEHRRILFETMADHFRLPALRCRIRGCRRKDICDGLLGAIDKPACFGHLHPIDAEQVDKIMAIMNEIYRGTLWPPPAKDGLRKWNEDQALEIFRAALPRMPECAAGFEILHASFTAPPTPPIDVQAFLAEAKLEVMRAEHSLAMMDARDAIQKAAARSASGACE